ncbi:MAG: mechanosensitive ion channel [Magnetococcales bacterium]|nr:mechanosensitive ion channel [Magnetococcales bacterium]
MKKIFQPVIALLTLLIVIPAMVFAGELAGSDTLAARKKSLQESTLLLSQAQREFELLKDDQKKRLSELQADHVDRNLVEQGRLDFEAARMSVESADVDLQSLTSVIKAEEAAITQLQRQIQALKSATGQDAETARKEQLPTLEMELAEKERLLSLDRQRLGTLEKLRKVAQLRHLLALEWVETLQDHFTTIQRKNQQEAQEQILAELQKKIMALRDKMVEWRGEIGSLPGDSSEVNGKRQLLEWRIFLAEERIRYFQLEIHIAELRSQRGPENDSLPGTETSTSEIQSRLDGLTGFLADSKAALDLLRRKEEVLNQLLTVTEKRPTTEWFKSLQTTDIQGLIQSYGGLRETVEGLRRTASKEQSSVRHMLSAQIRADLLTRQILPATVEEWQTLGAGLMAFPGELGNKGTAAFEDFGRAFKEAPLYSLGLLFALETLWLALALWVRGKMVKQQGGSESEEEVSFGRATALRVGLMIRKNFWILLPAGGLAIAVPVLELTPPGSVVLYTLAALPPAIGIGLQAMRFFLIEFNPNAGIAQIRRFRIMAAVLVLGSVYSGMVALTHAMTFAQPLQDLLDRLFMVFLFLGILPIFGLRQGVISGLSERLGEGYWMQVIRFLSLIIPLSFLASATIGLAGYVNLGWVAGKYISWLILVLVTWSILHGLWDDLNVYLKNRINLQVRNGLFWIQSVLDPIYRIVRLLLFAGAWFGLFFLYGWDIQSKPVQLLIKAWSWVLFDWGKTPIQVSDLALLIVLIGGFVWLSRWVRQLTYRVMFRKVADVGIRHSLSVFAQYAVVILGFLFTLRYMGIDLTNLAIVAGALGVGMGFGLQNVANNFVSGLLLLLERPIRTGDIIQASAKEGEVTKIGIRAVTLKTWDNHEVIIPNSEIASNTFTNWTHSNPVIRTFFLVGVHYDADPHHAIRVIREALKENEYILEDPEPVVWLSNFGASSVDLHVHYFSDWRVRKPMAIKSQALLQIWDRFKEEGIQIPYPQQDVYLKEVPDPWGCPVKSEPHPGMEEQLEKQQGEKENGNPE